jgi:hypothetical protein
VAAAGAAATMLARHRAGHTAQGRQVQEVRSGMGMMVMMMMMMTTLMTLMMVMECW